MVVELRNKDKILPRLYKDFVTFVEEISLIEESYLWRNVKVYVADPSSSREFLIIRLPSFLLKDRSLSAYMTAENLSVIQEFANILRGKKDFSMHIQTAVKKEHVEQFMPWLTKTYTVRYCRADSTTFQLHCKHREMTVRLTPANIKRLYPSASSVFVKRLETTPVYGYVNEKGELVATSGVGFLTKKSFSISYTETNPEYRGRGIAKCLTSLASEPLIRRGLIGVYAADITNQPSLGVAEGLGFQPYQDLKCFWQ